MEFGIFIQGWVPGPQAHDSEAEHRALLAEADLVECADRHGWKYVWISEHHALTEYSHMSASDVFMGYLARSTERIHLSSTRRSSRSASAGCSSGLNPAGRRYTAHGRRSTSRPCRRCPESQPRPLTTRRPVRACASARQWAALWTSKLRPGRRCVRRWAAPRAALARW